MAAIPRGRWTTYGELAQLGGTAAVAVGQHVANASGLENAYRVLGGDGKPRPDFHWDDPNDPRKVVDVLLKDGVRFTNGAADHSQRISVSELTSLIAVIDDDDEAAEVVKVTGGEWSWERYSAELGIPDEKIDIGRGLMNVLTEAVAERDLPWRPTFRKGYVVFHRPGGYNVLIIDVYWRRTPRLAVKLPASPSELGLMSPYPTLQESWTAQEREWGWTVGPLDPLPDGRPAIEIAERWNRGEASTTSVDSEAEGASPAA